LVDAARADQRDWLSRDEIYRLALAADAPIEVMAELYALPAGVYTQDQVAAALRAAGGRMPIRPWLIDQVRNHVTLATGMIISSVRRCGTRVPSPVAVIAPGASLMMRVVTALVGVRD
jgi:hypothetical protein